MVEYEGRWYEMQKDIVPNKGRDLQPAKMSNEEYGALCESIIYCGGVCIDNYNV